jgi:hypothetical protein
MGIGGVNVTFNDVVVHEAIDDIGGFALGGAHDVVIPEEVTLIDEGIGTDTGVLAEILGLNIEKLSDGATWAHSAYQSRFWEASRRITLPKMMPGAHVRVPWKSAWQRRLICSTCPQISVVGKIAEAEGETFDSDVLARPSMRERQLLRRKNAR